MATFSSQAFLGGLNFRPLYEHPFELTSTVKIPAGRTLADADVLKFFKIGANVDILEATLRTSDLDDGTDMTIDVGTSSVVDNIIDGSTIVQTGGRVSVTQGGDDPFADAPFLLVATPVDVQATIRGTATQTTADDADRYVTLTCVMVQHQTPTPSNVYQYASRYTDGVSS